MSKQTIGLIIIVLVFLFPFRWVYLEYPDPVKVNETFIDGGRIQYVFYFLLCVVGFIAFTIMGTSGKEDSKH